LLTAIELYEIDDFDGVQYILNSHDFSLTDLFEAEESAIKYAEKMKKLLVENK